MTGNWPIRTDEGGTVAGNWPLPIQGQMKVGLWQGIGLCHYKDR